MPKSDLEKQIEKQMRQQKQLEDKKRKEEQKRAREEAIRQRAASIVNGRESIAGLRILDETAEKVLDCLLNCERNENNHINFENDIFPTYVQSSISLETEKLTQYGMISGVIIWIGGGMLDLLPTAINYFQDKEKAIEEQEKQKEKNMQSIFNYGNIFYGDVSDSIITVDNSIHQIEKAIDEKGGADKEELKDLLNEVRELVDNMQTSRTIPKQKNLYKRLSNHLEKHGWFYGAIVQLLGTAAVGILGS